MTDAKEKEGLRALALGAGAITMDFKPAQYEKLLENDLSKGREQAEKICQDEIAWITAGKDVGLEFQKKYLPVK